MKDASLVMTTMSPGWRLGFCLLPSGGAGGTLQTISSKSGGLWLGTEPIVGAMRYQMRSLSLGKHGVLYLSENDLELGW